MELLKNSRRPLSPAVLAICLLFVLGVKSLGATITTPSFTIIYARNDEADARTVAGYAEDALSRVSRDLGYSGAISEQRVPIHVFSSRGDFLDVTGTDRKTFIVGRAWSAGHAQKIEVDASGTYSRLETVVAHEVTHIVIARILGSQITSLPLWANEGIARIESGEAGQSDAEAVGEAISTASFIPLEQIQERFPKDNEHASLAYAEGTSFMEFIRQKGGHDSLKKLLDRVARTGDFEKASSDLTGMPFGRLEGAWRKSVSKSYSAGWFLRNLPWTIGVVMALLCIAAYKAIMRKKRWNSAKWLIEDSYYDAEPLDYGDPPE
jgi:hypothetical protein